VSAHAYPWAAIIADAARAAGGFVLAAMPLCLIDMPAWQTALLRLVAGIFVLYAFATLRRALSPVGVGDEGIRVHGPWPTRLTWADVRRLRLAHYSTRRDGGGWMQLTLAGRGRRVSVDSRIVGFDVLVRRAAEAARRRPVRLDPATIVNLRALGIVVEPAVPAESTPR
jgi:hypothetical protein